jgi:hypothetical protein
VRFYFYGAVAPSWWSPRSADENQVARAQRFAAVILPGVFDETPSTAEPSGTFFRLANGEDHMDDVQLWIAPTGLVELHYALEPEVAGNGGLLLSAVVIAWLACQMADSINHDAYAELSTLAQRPVHQQTVDWHFTITAHVSTGRGPRSWDGIKFASDPPQRAKHEWASLPPDGYGAGLANSPRAQPAERVATALLTELLQANGYHSYGSAIETSVRVAREHGSVPLIGGPPPVATPPEPLNPAGPSAVPQPGFVQAPDLLTAAKRVEDEIETQRRIVEDAIPLKRVWAHLFPSGHWQTNRELFEQRVDYGLFKSLTDAYRWFNELNTNGHFVCGAPLTRGQVTQLREGLRQVVDASAAVRALIMQLEPPHDDPAALAAEIDALADKLAELIDARNAERSHIDTDVHAAFDRHTTTLYRLNYRDDALTLFDRALAKGATTASVRAQLEMPMSLSPNSLLPSTLRSIATRVRAPRA